MTKDRHEALRKDIEDYKILLAKYQTLRIEQEIQVADFERQGNMLKARNELLEKFRKENEDLAKQIVALSIKIEEQKADLGDLKKDYANLQRSYYLEKGKVHRMRKGQAEVYLWRGAAVFFFFAMIVVGSQN